MNSLRRISTALGSLRRLSAAFKKQFRYAKNHDFCKKETVP
jgi:hypothetical protein